MNEIIVNEFKPNYAVAPGDILDEELDYRGMSQAELAQRTGLAKKTINEIIKAKAPITPDSALKLERVLRQPADYWLNLEKMYQAFLARRAEMKRLAEDVTWLKNLPIRKMITLGWIKPCKPEAAQLDEVLSFFGIASVDQWESVWEQLGVAYHKSTVFEGHSVAISAWLRQGEIEAQAIDCAPFAAKQFKTSLEKIRALTCEPDPGVFVPALQKLCAAAGVAVVFVPELPKTHVSGATRWLNKDKALIQLSLRHKTNDHLWFTFFHEAGHILKHGKKALFLEGNGMDDPFEQEANEFASQFLVPAKLLNRLVSQPPYSKAAIRQFAEETGIAPGIVVGQLQHRKLLPYTHCNDLKVRYSWAHESS